MYTFILIMGCGAILGYSFRNKKFIRNTGSIIQIAVCLLLYLLGLSIGSNHLIIEHLGNFCSQAALIAFLSQTGSMLASWCVQHFIFNKNKKNEK